MNKFMAIVICLIIGIPIVVMAFALRVCLTVACFCLCYRSLPLFQTMVNDTIQKVERVEEFVPPHVTQEITHEESDEGVSVNPTSNQDSFWSDFENITM